MRSGTDTATGARALMIAAWIVFGLSQTGAQTPSDRLTIPQVRMSGQSTLAAVVSVVDERGGPVRGLGVSNFAVYLDGQPVGQFTVQQTEEAGRGISVVLAIDVSGSMRGARIDAARKAAMQFVANLGPNDYCALMAFGNSTSWLVEEFTRDKQAVQARLGGLEAVDSKTMLHEGFFRAAQKGGAAPTTQVAVVALTDGRDDGSSISLDQAAREAQLRNVPIYALGFGEDIDQEALSQITTLTGGRFFPARNIADLADFYLILLKQLSSQYVLEMPAAHLNLGDHKVSVELRYRGMVVPRERTFRIQAAAAVVPEPPPPAPPAGGGKSGVPAILAWLAVAAVLSAAGVFAYRRLRKPGAVATEPERKCVYCGKPLSGGDGLYCAACAGQSPATGEPQSGGPSQPVPAEGLPLPCIEVLCGSRSGERMPFSAERPFAIGRGSGQDLIIEGDRQMSREHAVIAKDANGRYALTNKSPNGTFINGRQIQIPEVLQEGDKIGLGNEEPKLIFHDSSGGK